MIPPEAQKDYGYKPGDEIITIRGSKKFGGFGLIKQTLIKEALLLRKMATFKIDPNGCVQLSVDLLKHPGLKPGDRLLPTRGSRFALGFVTKGPIFEKALKHPQLETFNCKK